MDNSSVLTGSAVAGDPAQTPSADEVRRLYRTMRTIKMADERSRAEIRSGTLKAALYPVHGLEAVCGSLSLVLEPSDYLVTTYRNLGDVLAKGAESSGSIIAESAGRVTGTSGGKGGPMHMVGPEIGLMPTTGVVGSGLPIAVGLGLACSLDGRGRVAVATFGDGATATGAYHEAVNMAALWKLPVLFLCQNNQWAEHTSLADHAPVTDLAARASAYGIFSAAVDGFDTFATWRVLAEAVRHCREGAGPAFVEARTYRLTGHSAAADTSYMPKDVLAAAEARDPVTALRAWLASQQLSSEGDLRKVDQAVADLVDEAFAFAYASAEPDAEHAADDVYFDQRGPVTL